MYKPHSAHPPNRAFHLHFSVWKYPNVQGYKDQVQKTDENLAAILSCSLILGDSSFLSLTEPWSCMLKAQDWPIKVSLFSFADWKWRLLIYSRGWQEHEVTAITQAFQDMLFTRHYIVVFILCLRHLRTSGTPWKILDWGSLAFIHV